MKVRLYLFLAAISVALAAAPAWTARRPRYGGTLRVEIGASVASLDPVVTASSPEETAALAQIGPLVFEHWGAVDAPIGAAGTGPFRVTSWDAGKWAELVANEEFREGRPFVDGIEIAMGRAAHERLVDLELSKTDLTDIPPQDARRAAERGVRVSASQPDELLALVFVGGNAGPNGAAATSARSAGKVTGQATGQKTGQANGPSRGGAVEQVMGQALSLAIDRVAIVNFILQKTGEPAGGLLPQWSSGTAFLFPAAAPGAADLEHAKELWKQIAASGPLVLGYDSADSLEQSVAERIVVNAKEAGVAVRAQAVPVAGAGAEKSRGAGLQAGHVGVQLVRWRMTSPLPGVALKDFLARIYAGPLAGVEAGAFPESASPEDIYGAQRAVLNTYRVVPLVWLPQVYGLSARLRDWKAPGPGENWPLADVWLDAETQTPTGVQ
ncbi:MAG TPA: ABC transporter substrate-binding protein [Candidatus Acidoferrales bacterium]